MARQVKVPQRSTDTALIARLAFVCTLVLFLLTAFLPSWRIWGISPWKQYPVWSIGAFAAIGLLVLVGEMRSRTLSPLPQETTSENQGNYWLVMSVTGVLFMVGFFFLRGITHFLGDGYQILSTLADSLHPIKTLELGACLAPLWLQEMLSGTPAERALLAYQIIAVGSGVLFIVLVTLGAYRLFEDNLRRILFCLGLLSGGYMLQFFGYVENYSLLLVSIGAFTIVGLLATQGKIARWWVLVPMFLAVFFHIVGVLLAPAAIFVLIHGKQLQLLKRTSKTAVWLIAGIVLVIGITAYVYLYSTNIFFRLAFLPPVASAFTPDGYTLFAPRHLLDLLNLLVLLVPGLLIFAVVWPSVPMRRLRATAEVRFLLATVLGTLLGACLFDPKLGMARDWDLFSFPGIPLTVLLYWSLLKFDAKAIAYRTAAVLAITAGLLSLAPRVVTQHIEPLGVALFKSYLHMDSARARTGMYYLTTYYRDRGDNAAARANEAERKRAFPSEEMSRQANALADSNRTYEAKSLALQALQLDANLSGAWMALSKCYVLERKFDSALFAARMADGLNPGNYVMQNNLALAYYYTRRTDEAEKIWLAQVKDSASHVPWVGLARVYQLKGDQQRYVHCMEQAATFQSCSPDQLSELAEWYASHREMEKATATITTALARGLDSASYQSFVAKYPSSATAR